MFAEAAVVVASILLALAADAWWDYHQDRSEETRRLAAVAAELRDARTGFEVHLTELATEDTLVAAILTEASSYSGRPRLLDSLLFRLGPFNEYDPPTSAYDDATTTGGLSLIRSDSVRRLLGGYRRALATDRMEQRIARDHFHSEIAPVWGQYVNGRDHLAVGASMFPGAVPDHLPDVPFASEYAEMLQDRRFSNELVERTINNFRIRRAHQNVIAAIDECWL